MVSRSSVFQKAFVVFHWLVRIGSRSWPVIIPTCWIVKHRSPFNNQATVLLKIAQLSTTRAWSEPKDLIRGPVQLISQSCGFTPPDPSTMVTSWELTPTTMATYSTFHWNYVFFFDFTSWQSEKTQIVPEMGEDWDLAIPCYTKHSVLKGPNKNPKEGFGSFHNPWRNGATASANASVGQGIAFTKGISQPRATAQCGTPTCMTCMITGAYQIGSSGVIILNQTRSECASQSARPNALWHRG